MLNTQINTEDAEYLAFIRDFVLIVCYVNITLKLAVKFAIHNSQLLFPINCLQLIVNILNSFI